MCGITGIVHLDGRPIGPMLLDRMTDALAHRGPDGRGMFIDRNVGLGHRRLAILDLSPSGAQPMRSRDGDVVITFNGEIYNFQEERSHLEAKGYRFRSRSDTEVLLALYEEYGTDCLRHLRGMFAFAIYNKRKRQLFCARDRVGKKPFKYFFDGKTFLFASELKALLRHPQCPRAIDREAIHHYLTMMYLPAPLTGFAGIQKLEAAHFLLLDLATGILRKERYWSLDYSQEEDYPEQVWRERILSTLEESVRLRMIADVPVGAFLSGGIDSATVVTLMAKLSSEPVRTFSIGSGISSHNELPDAQLIAGAVQSEHHPHVVRPNVMHLLPELVQAYEEPYADPSTVPTYLVARHTSDYVKVALNGDGGDENFGGYIRYSILAFSQAWERCQLFHPLVLAGTALFHTILRTTFSYRCHRFQRSMALPWAQRFLQYISFFTEEEKRTLYGPGLGSGLGRTDEFYAALTRGAREHARDLLHKALAMDFMTYLPDDLMPKVDLAAMHFGLECRSPFLDHHLLELTARIPASLKVQGWQRKRILKRALQGILPRETLHKRKQGFRLPLDHWFRTALRSYLTDRLLSDAPHKWEFFDRGSLERMLQEYFRSRIDFSDHLWALLFLDEWLRQYAKRA